ncbi:MAG: hypothetical protein ACTTKL_10950 [Treponema sp.]
MKDIDEFLHATSFAIGQNSRETVFCVADVACKKRVRAMLECTNHCCCLKTQLSRQQPNIISIEFSSENSGGRHTVKSFKRISPPPAIPHYTLNFPISPASPLYYPYSPAGGIERCVTVLNLYCLTQFSDENSQ